MFIKIAISTLTLFLSLTVQAKCEAVKWPFSDKPAELKAESLSGIRRDFLESYLYYELTSKDRTHGMAKVIFKYLINSEINENRHKMYEALQWAADLDSPNPYLFPLKDICEFERKVESIN